MGAGSYTQTLNAPDGRTLKKGKISFSAIDNAGITHNTATIEVLSDDSAIKTWNNIQSSWPEIGDIYEFDLTECTSFSIRFSPHEDWFRRYIGNISAEL